MKIDVNSLRSMRESRGWTQTHLAEVANLSLRTVQRIENSGSASPESTMAIASALSIDVKDLLKPQEVAAVDKRKWKFSWVGLVALLGGIGVWWSVAAESPHKLQISIDGSSNLHSFHEFNFPIDEKVEVLERNHFKLLVRVQKQDKYFLISSEISVPENDQFKTVAAPAILVEESKLASFEVPISSSEKYNFTFLIGG